MSGAVVLVALGAFVASCVQATAGLGFALILTPVLFAVMSPVQAIVTATALGLLLSLLVLLAEHRRPVIAWQEVTPILTAAVPGSACGLLLLQNVPKPFLQTAVGVAVTAAGVLGGTRGQGVTGRTERPAPSVWSRISLGFATGTLSTSTGVNGPPLALWLSRRGLSPGHLRDSLSALFVGLGTIAALTLTPVLQRGHPPAGQLAVAAIGVLAGHAIGRRAFSRLSSAWFHLAMRAIILASGVTCLALGVAAM